MTKFCNKCNKEKSKTDFNKNTQKRDGLQTTCRECNREYLKNHYKNNIKYYKNKSNIYKREIYTKIARLKESKPCTDCGQCYPHYVMDFDHISNNKKFNIAHLINSCDITKLENEISKCELVCSNCHRIRTYNRRDKHLELEYL